MNEDKILDKLTEHDEQFNKVFIKLIEHDDRLDDIQANMFTKDDRSPVMDLLEGIATVCKNIQEVHIMDFAAGNIKKGRNITA